MSEEPKRGFLENGQPCGDEGERCNNCDDCDKEEAYWKTSYELEGRKQFEVRKDLDLEPDATEDEVMEAARKLK